MFPLTHLYFYSMIYEPDTGGAIGAAFPDSILLSDLRWPQTHKNSINFYKSLSREEIEANSSFANGFLTHAVDSEGLDYYSDECYRGFEKGWAYIWTEEILEDVIKVCKIPESMGRWKAHNFIEMGVEIIVVRNNQWLSDWVKNAREKTDEISKASELLARFYGKDAGVFEKCIAGFFDFMSTSGDPNLLGKSYSKALFIRHGITDADPESIADVIIEASKIVNSKYDRFLAECKKEFMEKIPNLITA